MKELLKDIAVAIVIALIIILFIKPTIIKESSMEPTLYANDYIFLSKQAYHLFGDPEYGDIIVFHSHIENKISGGNKDLIKRIIGLPGDKIRISDGVVYRNGEALIENYTKDGYTTGEISELTVPEGKIFVMGDNRVVSLDSRSEEVGCVNIDDILGKAVFRLYPFNKIGTL